MHEYIVLFCQEGTTFIHCSDYLNNRQTTNKQGNRRRTSNLLVRHLFLLRFVHVFLLLILLLRFFVYAMHALYAHLCMHACTCIHECIPIWKKSRDSEVVSPSYSSCTKQASKHEKERECCIHLVVLLMLLLLLLLVVSIHLCS